MNFLFCISFNLTKCTEAIPWAAQIACDQGWVRVCVESDSKICIDAFHGRISDSPWRIQICVSKLCALFSSHPLGLLNGLKGMLIVLPIILLGGLLGSVFGEFFYCNVGPDCFVQAYLADMVEAAPVLGV